MKKPFAWPPICSNCVYSNDGSSPADGGWLLCRRRAPAALRIADDEYAGGIATFPRVGRDDWCGEWVQNCINTGERRQRDFLSGELEEFDYTFAGRSCD